MKTLSLVVLTLTIVWVLIYCHMPWFMWPVIILLGAVGVKEINPPQKKKKEPVTFYFKTPQDEE